MLMTALKQHTYATRRLLVGETFEVTRPRDAKILRALRRARASDEPDAPAKEEPEHKPGEAAPQEEPPKDEPGRDNGGDEEDEEEAGERDAAAGLSARGFAAGPRRGRARLSRDIAAKG
jgi:hypothetical protein